MMPALMKYAPLPEHVAYRAINPDVVTEKNRGNFRDSLCETARIVLPLHGVDLTVKRPSFSCSMKSASVHQPARIIRGKWPCRNYR